MLTPMQRAPRAKLAAAPPGIPGVSAVPPSRLGVLSTLYCTAQNLL